MYFRWCISKYYTNDFLPIDIAQFNTIQPKRELFNVTEMETYPDINSFKYNH